MLNHNETFAGAASLTQASQGKAPGLKVKTHFKAGIRAMNHKETLARDAARTHVPES